MARKLSWGRKNDLGGHLKYIKKDHHEVSRGIKKNHHAPAVQYATDLRTKRDNNKKADGDLVVTWCTFSVRNEATLLKPTSFANKLYSQSENSSIGRKGTFHRHTVKAELGPYLKDYYVQKVVIHQRFQREDFVVEHQKRGKATRSAPHLQYHHSKGAWGLQYPQNCA